MHEWDLIIWACMQWTFCDRLAARASTSKSMKLLSVLDSGRNEASEHLVPVALGNAKRGFM
eukprot:6100666-Amphidinium_carterae.1